MIPKLIARHKNLLASKQEPIGRHLILLHMSRMTPRFRSNRFRLHPTYSENVMRHFKPFRG
jgi:hypothetical protein